MPSVGTDKIEPRPKLAVNKRFTVLFMGRFVALKGVETVVRSFAQFFKQRSAAEQADLHLLMVGKGPEKDGLIDLAQSLGLGQAIEFVDWLPHDQVGNIYRSASVFFFPSHEGAGMVVAEAQANGVPVLCYANDGPGELVNPSGSIRVPYVTHQAAITTFAEQLSVLYDNPKKRLQMAENAMEYIEQYLDWEVKGDFLQRIYRKIGGLKPEYNRAHTLIKTL
jgi:glycosyltransferase involved in cell wall biosynthesis